MLHIAHVDQLSEPFALADDSLGVLLVMLQAKHGVNGKQLLHLLIIRDDDIIFNIWDVVLLMLAYPFSEVICAVLGVRSNLQFLTT